MNATEAPLGERGIVRCRGCGGSALVSALDLGSQPLANELPRGPGARAETFPLHLRVCTDCGLGQVGEYVLPDRIFGDYPYLSSMSETWVEHTAQYARAAIERLGMSADDLVVEIASNDGCLLKGFQEEGLRVLGVEPAANVAALASEAGVPTMTSFFGRETAREIVRSHGHPAVIAANNVMAHVPDLDDFVGGFAELSGPDTVLTVENPSFTLLLELGQFDTIYHEHFSYLSVHAVSRIVANHGLELFDVEDLPTHGGSYRYWIAPQGQRSRSDSVTEAAQQELAAGLLSADKYRVFAERCRTTIDGLTDWLHERRSIGHRVAAYGAAAKGNTLLNAAGVTDEDILVVADASPEKQGRYLPGSGILVIPPESLVKYHPDDVLLLPWNIRDEVRDFLPRLAPGAEGWIAVPQMERFVP